MSIKYSIWIGVLLITISLVSMGCTEKPSPSWEEKLEMPSNVIPVEKSMDYKAGDNSPKLIWTGCGITQKAFMGAAALEYEEQTGIMIEITGGGATKGIRATAGGTSDMGGTCRVALPEKYPGENVLLTHVAWDALVFITHNSNPIDGITTQQAKDILLGKITNWKELGGPDQRIIPVLRVQDETGKLSGVGYMTRLMLFGDVDMNFTEDAVFKTSSGPVEEYVESTPFTFAVSGISSSRKRDLKIMKLDGMEPSKENIILGEYPLFRPLYLATSVEPTGEVDNFIEWILGEDGQRVISAQDTVNLEEGRGLKEKFRYWHNTYMIRNYEGSP